MDNSNVNIDLIRGHVDTIILKSLYLEDKYGYEILNEIKDKSKGMYTLKQPTLYSCLRRLEKQGYIRSYKGDTSNGAQRVYYSLQPAGRAFLESDQHQWEFSRTIIDSLLSDEEFDPEKHVAPFDPSNFRPLTRRNKSSVDEDSDSEVNVNAETSRSYNVSDDNDNMFNPSEDYVIPPEVVAPPVDEYDKIPHEYLGSTYPQNRSAVPSENGYSEYREEFYGERNYAGNRDGYGCERPEEYSEGKEHVYSSDETDTFLKNEKIDDVTNSIQQQIYDEEQEEDVEEIEDYDAPSVATSQPVFYGDERSEEKLSDSSKEGNYTVYDAKEEKCDEEVRTEAFERLYERKPVEEKKPDVKTYNTDIADDRRYDDYANRQTVNYIDSFDSIYSVPMTQVTPSSNSSSISSDDEKIDYLSTSELKSKMMAEGYNLRPYVKKNTSEYYINQYYFSNKLNRDSSILTYIVYAVGVLIAYFSTAPTYGHNFGALAGFLALGLLYPIAMFVAYCVDPQKRIKANFNAKNAVINSLIVIINAVILIVLIGFLACNARIDNINSMVRPVIIPLVFLLIIPIAIAIYYWLYKSSHYHVN